jgi:hypothetical protein
MMIGIARPRRPSTIVAGLLGVLAAFLVAAPAQADHRGHGGFHGGGFHGGFVSPGFHHFHSFAFFGAGFYPGYYYGAYPYPAYYPPPVYVSPTDCYNTVPRSPGVADLYTCAGQYVGPVAVP